MVRGSVRDYARRTPCGADVGLVVEVADTSLEDDRKMALTYSGGSIPVYWIVNLKARQVEVYTLVKRRGTASGYGRPRVFKAGQSVPVVLDGVEVGRIAVADILP